MILLQSVPKCGICVLMVIVTIMLSSGFSRQAAAADDKMYWTVENKIQRADLDGSAVEDVFTAQSGTSVQGIAIDTIGRKVYWTNVSPPERIRRADLDGSNIEDLVTTGLQSPRALEIDPIGGKMYWIDTSGDKIQRADLDGSNVEDVVTAADGLDAPIAVAVAPVLGKLYWSDDTANKIQRANLDGSNIEDVVTAGLSNPQGIEVDWVRGKLYWTDFGTNKIQRANLDGSNVEDVIAAGLGGPLGMALDLVAEKMYWVNINTDKIQRANLDGSNVEDLLTTAPELSDTLRIALDVSSPDQDRDNDSIADTSDNCVETPNPTQENIDGDALGDICDRDTISTNFVSNDGAFISQTPFYSARVDATGMIAFGESGGYFPDSPLPNNFPAEFIRISPDHFAAESGAGFPAEANSGLAQASWNHVTAQTQFVCNPASDSDCAALDPQDRVIRGHVNSAANGITYSVEVPPAATVAGKPYSLTVELDLRDHCGSGCNINASEVEGFPVTEKTGRISIFAATDTIRFGAPQCVAFGTSNVLEDDGTNLTVIEQTTKELSDTAQTCPGGAECGANVSGGEREPLMQSSYMTEENRGDNVLGTWTMVADMAPDTYIMTAKCPASFVDIHRQLTSRFGLGFSISSLTEANFGSGNTVKLNRSVRFDEEAVVTGTDTAFVVENAPLGGGGFHTFDGEATDYSLLPNDGGTLAVERIVDQGPQAGMSFQGSDVQLSGTTSYTCPDGCSGVSVRPGSRVAPSHPGLTASPSRHVANKMVRPRFEIERLDVMDASYALSARDVHIDAEAITLRQREDPTCVSASAKQTCYFGIKVKGDEGPVVNWNPSEIEDHRVVSGPVDMSACAGADAVGDGSCHPTLLYDPPQVGQASLKVRQLNISGLADVTNPNFTLMQPPGGGVLCDGLETCEIGNEEFDGVGNCVTRGGPLAPASLVTGVEEAVRVSGKSNTCRKGLHGTLCQEGQPLSFDAALNPGGVEPVPTTKACLQNMKMTNITSGVVIGSNTDVFVRDAEINNALNTGISFGNTSANEATRPDVLAAGGSCDPHPTIPDACLTAGNISSCPDCAIGGKDLRANIAEGKSARIKVDVRDSWICSDPATLEPTCGQNIVIPTSSVNDQDLTIEQATSDRTIARRPMALAGLPITIHEGPDVAKHPQLLEYTIANNNIGVQSPAIGKDNFNAVVPAASVAEETIVHNAYLPGGGQPPVTGDSPADLQELIATVQQDPETLRERDEIVAMAEPEPLPVGTVDENDVPIDTCPADPEKTAPGTCGCGVAETDSDGDGAPDCVDNCPADANPELADTDNDGLGDACDNCPDVANADQVDIDEDGEGNICDATPHHGECACGSRGNHGMYVRCVAKALKAEGNQHRGDIKSAAARSECKLLHPLRHELTRKLKALRKAIGRRHRSDDE